MWIINDELEKFRLGLFIYITKPVTKLLYDVSIISEAGLPF